MQSLLWTSSPPVSRFGPRGLVIQRKSLKQRASQSEPIVPESPIDIITHDLDYLEKALRLNLHNPLESMMDAHDQMVCSLNPKEAEKRTKELDEKLRELHQELHRAHEAIHETEARMLESLEVVTEMEKKMSSLKKSNPEIYPVQEPKKQPLPRPLNRKKQGLKNTLDLPTKLKENWYPVEFSSNLKKETAFPLELFGEKWTLLRCAQDCAIPSTSVSRDDGDVVTCTSEEGIALANVREVHGFVWIWPGESTPGDIPDFVNPPDGFQIHAELVLEVPVEHGLLLENLLDLAHAPFTHTSTFAKGWPVPDAVKFHTTQLLGGNWDPYPIDMSFEIPCMVLSLIGLQQPGKIQRGARAASCANHLHQLHVCLPKNDRCTKLLYRMSLDFLHWTRGVPGIQDFWSRIARQVLGEDLVLVEGQQDRMLRGSSVWRNPVSYDKLGIRYRRWRNSIEDEEEVVDSEFRMSAGEIFSIEDITKIS